MTTPIFRAARQPAGRRLRPLALAVASLFLLPGARGGGAAPALPSGMEVVRGQAVIAPGTGPRMTITHSANALLNWQQFSIGSGHAVHFAQPSAASKVLNRVVGSDPSQILGSLTSNGQVWLLNPNGVLFGAGARVDVGGLVASTLQLSNAQWDSGVASGVFNLSGAAGGVFGEVVNQGELRSTSGGRVLLIAQGGVRNEGLVEAPDGQVVLAAGQSVDLVDTATPRLGVRLTAPQGQVLNLGRLMAQGGQIDLQAALVNQQGIVRADSLGTGPGGQVLLSGSQGVTLAAASHTSADGAGAGGQVQVDAGGGALMAAGRLQAAGAAGTGGGVTLLGRQVGLLDGAVVDVSGAAGGGQVHLGGGLGGQDPAYRNAEAVWMAPGARILADATARGDGGRVVLWGSQAARVYGHFSARGGALGGDGGFIETSGGWVDAQPASLRTDAPAGRAGQWLIDPHDIVISNEVSTSGVTGGPDFTSTSDTARIGTATLAAALDANNNVTITTAAGGEGDGDIRLEGAFLFVAPTSPVSLTLNAHRNITMEGSSLQSLNAPLTVQFNAGRLGQRADAEDGGGAVRIRFSTISTAGGNILVGGSSLACGAGDICRPDRTGAVAGGGSGGVGTGILISGSSLQAGTGRIQLQGHSVVSRVEDLTAGVAILAGSQLDARVIDIHGTVDNGGFDGGYGVQINGSGLSATETLRVRGSVDAANTSSFAPSMGVEVAGGSLLRIGRITPVTEGGNDNPTPEDTVPGALTLEGRVAGGSPSGNLLSAARRGVSLGDNDSAIVALGGATVDITGDVTGSSDGPIGFGIWVEPGERSAIDASAGSRLSLLSLADIRLGGDILAPTGGQLSITAGGTLSIDGASITGLPASASLVADRIAIGTTGAASQVSFSGETALSLRARDLRLGLDQSFDGETDLTIDQDAARDLPTQRALARKSLLAFAPPTSPDALLASGGPIRIEADEVRLGFSAAVYSSAEGDAIVLSGQQTGTAVATFINLAGADALQAPSGRWLVQATDSLDNDTSSGETFVPGGLRASFLQYGVTPGSGEAAETGNGFQFTARPEVSLFGEGRFTKAYDGSAGLELGESGFQVTGLRGQDSLVAPLQFEDSAAGLDKPLVIGTGAGGNVAVTADGTPVYGYAINQPSLRASIEPLGLGLASVTVANKVYDGTTRATVTNWALTGMLEGDQVQVVAGTATFGDANVGTGKAVNATVTQLGGAQGGNYVLTGLSATGLADITPATLVYLADAVAVAQGQVLPTLTGRVTGLVAGETLATATQGSLAFQTEVGSTPEPGRYAVAGTGLTAQNYVFVQAPVNAVALTVQAPPPPPVPETVAPTPNLFLAQQSVVAVLAPSEASTAASGRALDALPAVQADAGKSPSFAGLDLDRMSTASLAAVLAARDAYKKSVFNDAITQLEANPAAADATGCATPQQAASGQCLVIQPFSAGLDISNARVQERAPVTVPGAAAPASPAPAPSVAAAPAAPAAAPAAPAAAPPAPPPARRVAALPADTQVNLPAPRRVTQAAVPQIQRKIAVVIGIDQYLDDRIPRLGNAVADARAVAATLEQRLGYETVVLENAGRATIFRVLNQLAGQARPTDSVVLYYAGHGERVEKTGQGYWQPADADAGRPETWISNADIDRLLRQVPAQQLALVSDSCYAGGLVSGDRIRGVAASQDPSTLLGRRSVVVMTSGGNEPVFDSGQNGHSPFAFSLMQAINQLGGWKPGSNVFEQVRFAVARKLPQRPQYGASREGGHEAGDYLFEQRQLQLTR